MTLTRQIVALQVVVETRAGRAKVGNAARGTDACARKDDDVLARGQESCKGGNVGRTTGLEVSREVS